jgi:hypothetical protein
LEDSNKIELKYAGKAHTGLTWLSTETSGSL